ncbi:MAG: hypothetical protein H6835_10860 [Planctomycetes bacterium]|nr:hypothetical protein [Planctomycetota bacterium]
MPSRDRVGNGIDIELGELTAPTTTFTLPDLRSVICQGRVELPPDAPTARIVVVARRAEASGRSIVGPMLNHPFVVGIDDAGGFAIDLPPAKYTLQLADLQSGLVFHTEATDLELAAGETPELVLRPTLHWLEVHFETDAEGAPAICSGVQLQVPRASDAASNSLWPGGWSGNVEQLYCAVEAGSRELRLLVPAASLALHAMSPFAHPGAGNSGPVDRATIEVTEPVHRVTMRVPPPK